MAIPPLLDELVRAPGPSGSEGAVAAIVRREAEDVGAEVAGDVLGSTTARIRGTGGAARSLALVAHVDQVGVIVTSAGADGRLRVRPLGAWSPRVVVGGRLRILTDRGEVPAVGVRVGGEGDPGWADVRLDVGASDAAGALELVRAGDPAVIVGEPIELAGGRFASAALDDRLGVYVALETLRRLAARPPAWDVVLVASVQEEGGTATGATVATARLRPDAAVIVECTYASDAPSGPEPWGDVPLGGGPAVFRGPVAHPAISAGLVAAAAAVGVPVGVEAGRETWSDADEVFVAADGVPVGMLSIPLRHMHTASEIAQLSDAEAAVDVLEGYARSLTADASFVR